MEIQLLLSFNCRHWHPRFKLSIGPEGLKLDVSIAVIGTPGSYVSHFFTRLMEAKFQLPSLAPPVQTHKAPNGESLFQLPSLAIPVQTFLDLILKKMSFNCRHWLYRFKPHP
ncbi:hypothetical protein BGP_1346 [Beggiatoa sp. PS]|nr:hypothetical protein BGP_1346 [Beggiatoa sp. PS]